MKIENDYKGSLNMTKLSQIDRIHVLVESIIKSQVVILNYFWVPKGAGSTKPTTGEFKFKAFFEFIVSIFWYTMTLEIEYDYRESSNMTKLYQIDRRIQNTCLC